MCNMGVRRGILSCNLVTTATPNHAPKPDIRPTQIPRTIVTIAFYGRTDLVRSSLFATLIDSTG
jgi:hypothetical protein